MQTRLIALTVFAGLVLAVTVLPWGSKTTWMNPVTGAQHTEYRTLLFGDQPSDKSTPLSQFADANRIPAKGEPHKIEGERFSLFRLVVSREHGKAPAIYQFTPDLQALWMRNRPEGAVRDFLRQMSEANEASRTKLVDDAIHEVLR